MKTKIEIIQALLDDRRITAQEAMILMEKEKEYVYYPTYPVSPWYVPLVTYGTGTITPCIGHTTCGDTTMTYTGSN